MATFVRDLRGWFRAGLSLCVLALGWILLSGQTSYTDDDIQKMKAHYEGKKGSRGLAVTFPAEFWTRPYEPPRLVDWMLPYQDWEEEYRRYFYRHYRDPRLEFKPQAIVMHYTVTPDSGSVRDGFIRGCQMSAGPRGKTVFGHASVQLMINPQGTVYQLMPLDRRCTGAYGVNHVALSIEMVATDEADLLNHPRQLWASFCLVRHLMRRFDIPLDNVYGHYEVSQGRTVVPEYLDYADTECPDRYPPACARSDPGATYMGWLRTYLRRLGPAPEE